MNDSSKWARQKVRIPAIGLLILSLLTIFLLTLALIFNVWLLTSGVAAQMKQPPGMSKETQIALRMIWNILMQGVNMVIAYGAIRMKALKSYRLSKAACILALIPCLGPMFILGIPFGIFGLLALNQDRVRAAFDEPARSKVPDHPPPTNLE